MFWDGERWLPDDGRLLLQPRPPARRRFRDWLSTGVMGIVLVGLIVPIVATQAATQSARALLASWSADSTVTVYQETNPRINYWGRWASAYYPDYLGGGARASNAASDKVSLRFSGAAVSWVGPVGPTRGKARVYIDGKLATTVNTWASSFLPTRVLFKRTWAAAGSHRISIISLGTQGHPTVALDAFVVRLDTADAGLPVDDLGSPIGTAPTDPSTPPDPGAPTNEPTGAPALPPTATPAAPPTATPTLPPTAPPTVPPTAPPTVPPTAPPTATPTVPPSSGTAMPTSSLPGWNLVFNDDFNTAVARGAFPAAVSSKWGAYPSPWKDSSKNGTYSPDIVAFQNGLMDIWLHTENGVHKVAAPLPKIGDQLYGRYAIRFRADAVPGYKLAWLLWPQSGAWPADGEIDFPEGELNGTLSAFMHRDGASSGSDQDAFSTGSNASGWHTAVIEWSPARVRFLFDDRVIGTSTSRIPNSPMHWVIQCETTLNGSVPSSSAQGHVQVDWVAAWSYAP